MIFDSERRMEKLKKSVKNMSINLKVYIECISFKLFMPQANSVVELLGGESSPSVLDRFLQTLQEYSLD